MCVPVFSPSQEPQLHTTPIASLSWLYDHHKLAADCVLLVAKIVILLLPVQSRLDHLQ